MPDLPHTVASWSPRVRWCTTQPGQAGPWFKPRAKSNVAICWCGGTTASRAEPSHGETSDKGSASASQTAGSSCAGPAPAFTSDLLTETPMRHSAGKLRRRRTLRAREPLALGRAGARIFPRSLSNHGRGAPVAAFHLRHRRGVLEKERALTDQQGLLEGKKHFTPGFGCGIRC